MMYIFVMFIKKKHPLKWLCMFFFRALYDPKQHISQLAFFGGTCKIAIPWSNLEWQLYTALLYMAL